MQKGKATISIMDVSSKMLRLACIFLCIVYNLNLMLMFGRLIFLVYYKELPTELECVEAAVSFFSSSGLGFK